MHAAFPVFDREAFSLAYRQGRASPMVLQTIFFLGLTVCADELLKKAGFSDRAVARRTHFRRAKALYDADYDRDPMNIAAVLLLLGFYWTGYDEQKDVCHWTCCATTFAQSRGFHREQPGLGPRERSMRRRIWWAIYVGCAPKKSRVGADNCRLAIGIQRRRSDDHVAYGTRTAILSS